MALTKYHKKGMFRKIGTKKVSKKLGINIISQGYGMFYFNKDKGGIHQYESNKDNLEIDTLREINKIGIENIRPYNYDD